MKSFKLIVAIVLCTMSQITLAQADPVLGYGKHSIDPVTKKKFVTYTFKVTGKAGGNGTSSFVLGSAPDEAQFHLETIYKSVFDLTPPMVISSPTGWTGKMGEQMESNQYYIEWRANNGLTTRIAAGASNDQFSVRLPKADPTYVTAFYKSSEQSFPAPVRKVIPFDTTAPKLSIFLSGHPHGKHHMHHPMGHTNHRPNWIEVEVSPQITDNYDPYPVVLLTSITSKDPSFKAATDIDALFNEETRTFWVKRAPHRIYTITYTGMDASGNKTVVSKDISAH